MKKKIGLLVLAASLMVSQTALAGKWTGTVPTQTRADWAAEYDTPMVGPAATRITADLLDQPNGNALMTYFQSVRVQVLDVEGDWVKVRVGDADSGSLTGYMAADALTYTEDGIRTLLGRIIAYASKGAVKVMKECDEKSGEIARTELGWTRILGYNDGWLHVRTLDAPEKTGFVSGSLNDYEFIQNDAIDYCITEPKDDELSYEKAVEEAKRILLEQQIPYNGSEEPVTREMLDACSTWVECNYVPRSEAPLTYMVSFYSTDEMRRDGIPDVYAIIDLKVEKDEVVDFGFGNG
mgnify:FL=1